MVLALGRLRQDDHKFESALGTYQVPGYLGDIALLTALVQSMIRRSWFLCSKWEKSKQSTWMG
jgi:hypothetical protein